MISEAFSKVTGRGAEDNFIGLPEASDAIFAISSSDKFIAGVKEWMNCSTASTTRSGVPFKVEKAKRPASSAGRFVCVLSVEYSRF